MFHKRSRAAFEADTITSFASYGTSITDDANGDDGGFVPVWKQDVRDEKGRRRLHGAFTGGWSAGYFNTVGSKEGWAPSTFVSSRTDRRRDTGKEQCLEDFMDEEDFADVAESEKIGTSGVFAGLGSSTKPAGSAHGGLSDLLRLGGDTIGFTLLRKMGWRDGQGIGPRVRRAARLGQGEASVSEADTHLFAPDDVPLMTADAVLGAQGLGYSTNATTSRAIPRRALGTGMPPLHWLGARDHDNEGDSNDRSVTPFTTASRLSPRSQRGKGGMGVGILNDTGSDDEDPFELGPRISYNRTAEARGSAKKTKRPNRAASSSSSMTFAPNGARPGPRPLKGHSSAPVLRGFAVAEQPTDGAPPGAFGIPEIPHGWTPSKAAPMLDRHDASGDIRHFSLTSHDPRSRGSALGEQTLPGKSVFDFLSTSARDRVVAATGRRDLPPARAEEPDLRSSKPEADLLLEGMVPSLSRETALAALSRGSAGGDPYSNDAAKRARYLEYLKLQGGLARTPPARSAGASDQEYLNEMGEFHSCANIFKPMSGTIASRFAPASHQPARPTQSASGDANGIQDLGLPTARPLPTPSLDPAEEAAKLGMYGGMTRSVEDFPPTRLLCKRFNVKPPAHTSFEKPAQGVSESSARNASTPETMSGRGTKIRSPSSASLANKHQVGIDGPRPAQALLASAPTTDEMLRAVFGDSSEDEG